MRAVHASMMDAVGAATDDRTQAHARLADAAAPGLAAAPLVPFARGARLQALALQQAGRQAAQAWQAGTAWPTLLADPAALQQGIALLTAAQQQWLLLQAQWLDDLADWGRQAAHVGQANTVSKFVDQEMDLVQQGMALLGNQATATARLAENIQNNVAFWFSQRLPSVT